MKIVLSLLLSITLFTIYGCSKPQDEPKTYKVGIVAYMDTSAETIDGFKNGLKKYGYTEGENLKYIDFGYANSIQDISKIVNEILEKKPDLIFTCTTPASGITYKMTRDMNIPVIFGPVNDPLGAGIVKNLNLPGENITGVKLSPSDSKRLEWIKVLNPDVTKVLVPYNPSDKSSNITVQHITEDAKKLGLALETYKTQTQADVDSLLADFPPDVQAVFLPRDGLVLSNAAAIGKVCNEKKIILSTPRYAQVKAGATMGFGFIDFKLGEQAARIASTVLKGANPGDIPVETAEDYLFINHDTATLIGLKLDDKIYNQIYRE